MIKLGYNVIVRSWENDRDAYSSETMHFPSLNEVQRVVSLLKHLKREDLTNLYDGDRGEEVEKVAKAHGYDEEIFYDLIYDLGLSSQYYSVRHIEKIEVVNVKALDYEVVEI